MLLPDAPPRKRQTKKISPERQPCVMVSPSPEQLIEPTVVASTSGMPSGVEASTSGPSCSFDLLPREPEPSTSGVSRSAEPCPAEISFEDDGEWPGGDIDVGAEVSISSTSLPITCYYRATFSNWCWRQKC